MADIVELELEIQQLVAGGDGLGRFEGIPLFVPRSAPGDRLRVRITDRRADFGRAEIVEILRPGPGRRQPPCPVFASCGGCDLQHLEDAHQLELKAAAVRETLVRIGKIELEDDVARVAGDAWGYRLRTQLHTGETEHGVAVGYHARGSQELVPIERCPILAPKLDALVSQLPGLLDDAPRPRIDLALGDDGSVSVAPPVPGLDTAPIALSVGEFTYRFDARVFFQGHRGLLEDLVTLAVGDWQGEKAFDLFAGVGLFALPLARRYGQVTAVEGDRIAARYLRQNLRAAGILAEVDNCSIEGWIDRLPVGADRVIVDPPRVGLSTEVRLALNDKRPKRLTYVSCHAATLARDLRSLRRAFDIETVTFVDLFPQTGHLETVVQLTAKSAEVDAEDRA